MKYFFLIWLFTTTSLLASSKHLKFTIPKGEVTVTTHNKSTLEVHEAGLLCRIKQQQVKTSTLISSLTPKCEHRLDIKLPQSWPISGKLETGTVEIVGPKEAIDLNVETGKVIIEASSKTVAVQVKTGSITVNIPGGSTNISMDTGEVGVAYSSPLPQGSIKVKNKTGSVNILLPKKIKIRSELSVGTGSMHSDFTDVKESPFNVWVQIGTGSLNLKSI